MNEHDIPTTDPKTRRLLRILVAALIAGALILGVFWLRAYTDPIENYQPLLEEAVEEYVALRGAQEELVAVPETSRRSGRFQTDWEELTARWEALYASVQEIDNPPEFEQTHTELVRTIREHTLAAQALRDAPTSGGFEIHIDEARMAGADFRAALEAESRPYTDE
jgi:hypothetical protein